MKQVKESNIRSIYQVCIEKGYIKDIDYKTFNQVVRDFHQEISDEIIKGYKFQPGFRLGLFNLVKDIRRGATVNWGASNKLKQSILDNGEIPYNKETAPDGKEWLLYFLDNDYYKWRWAKIGSAKFTPNILYFGFRASCRNRRIVGKVIAENKLTADNYGEYKQVSNM